MKFLRLLLLLPGLALAQSWPAHPITLVMGFPAGSGVDVVERPEVNATGARVVPQRYPRPGRPNAKVDLYIQAIGGARTRVDLGDNPDVYLARVNWSKDGKILYVQRESRDQGNPVGVSEACPRAPSLPCKGRVAPKAPGGVTLSGPFDVSPTPPLCGDPPPAGEGLK